MTFGSESNDDVKSPADALDGGIPNKEYMPLN